ncbi:MAG: ATP-binding protein [Pseudonocardia sp.]
MRPSKAKSLLDYLPRGGMLDEVDWQRRHRLLERILLGHVPGLAVIGLLLGHQLLTIGLVLLAPIACIVLGHVLPGRRGPAVAVTTGLVYCSTALVGLTGGAIEAHFHFFIIIGFIALYQDWAPFLCNIALTVLTHGIGSAWQQNLIFSHTSGQGNPWLWSLLHGVAVLAACIGMTLFWRVTEDSQNEKNALATQLADTEIGRRQFTSDLLVNLARRNQTMLYRQLDIINQLEESEKDPDALAELFRLDHLATRVRRNAESLLVLSGEQPARVWREPVPLRDVVRAAIAETEDLERVAFTVDEVTAVSGQCVTDLTHLLAELTENAVRFSPPDSVVTIRTRPSSARNAEGYLLTIEDWGVGMPEQELATANALLARPPEVDLSVAQRLGFHVVARLAARHGIGVSLNATPGSGITAVVQLPVALLEQTREPSRHAMPEKVAARNGSRPHAALGDSAAPHRGGALDTLTREAPSRMLTLPPAEPPADGGWTGWWEAPAPDVPAPRSSEPSSYVPRAEPAPAPQPPAERVAAERPEPHRAPVPMPTTGSLSLFVPQHGPGNGAQTGSTPAPRDPSPAEGLRAGPSRRPVADGPGATVQGLRRRVPQASLAPELRRGTQDPEPDTGPPVVAGPSAASALSRYQASRRSAQAVVDGDGSAR